MNHCVAYSHCSLNEISFLEFKNLNQKIFSYENERMTELITFGKSGKKEKEPLANVDFMNSRVFRPISNWKNEDD